MALGQRPNVNVDPEVAHRQKRVALLVGQVHAVEVESVAEVRSKLPNAYLRLQLIAQVAFRLAGHKVLPRRKLQEYHHRNNEQ